jgi:hypothetical protein
MTSLVGAARRVIRARNPRSIESTRANSQAHCCRGIVRIRNGGAAILGEGRTENSLLASKSRKFPSSLDESARGLINSNDAKVIDMPNQRRAN